MTDMKCPFCNVELDADSQSWDWGCSNPDCKTAGTMCGTKELWQELVRTRKALDVAKSSLKSMQEYAAIVMSELQKNALGGFQKPVSRLQDMAHQAQKQIKAITEKDK